MLHNKHAHKSIRAFIVLSLLVWHRGKHTACKPENTQQSIYLCHSVITGDSRCTNSNLLTFQNHSTLLWSLICLFPKFYKTHDRFWVILPKKDRQINKKWWKQYPAKSGRS